MDISTAFPARLRAIREKRKLSQAAIAREMNVNRSTACYWERDGGPIPDVRTLDKLATLLGVSVDYLIGRSDVESTSADTQAICSTLGLTETAVDRILLLKELSERPGTGRNASWVNILLSCAQEDFAQLDTTLCRALSAAEPVSVPEGDDVTSHMLGKTGNVVAIRRCLRASGYEIVDRDEHLAMCSIQAANALVEVLQAYGAQLELEAQTAEQHGSRRSRGQD